MATSFPTSRDNFTNPTATDPMNSGTVPHATQHSDLNDAIEAVEALLPITSEGSVPRGILPSGLKTVTAAQGSIVGTAVDVTGFSATVTVGTGRNIKLSFYCHVKSTVAGDKVEMTINEGATILQYNDTVLPIANADQTVQGFVIIAPSAGSHTYKMTIGRGSGTGTLTLDAAATFPAQFVVEDVGKA